jgi:hypothetical protein
MYMKFELVVFVLKIYFHDEKTKRGQNVPLSYNSTKVLAHLDFLNNRREVNQPKNPQIRSA